jgi:uracil-DNA glycosylase family 4
VKSLSKKKTTARVLPAGDYISEMYRLVKIPSLREAAACLSDNEIQDLEADATKPLTRDPFKVQMLGEQVGVPFMDFKQSLPSYSVDLSNFVDFIKLGSTENHPAVGQLDMSSLDQVLSTCNLCPLRSECPERGPNYPQGRVDSDIMLIGRNPDTDDYETGQFFSPNSPAGDRICSFLSDAGIYRDECFITSVCKCHSYDNRPPTYGEMLTCLPYLRREIDIIRPKLVITFGSEAMAAVTPYTTKVSDHIGEILDKPVGMAGSVDAKVVISVNPVAALRSERCQSDLAYSATVIKKFLDEVTK